MLCFVMCYVNFFSQVLCYVLLCGKSKFFVLCYVMCYVIDFFAKKAKMRFVNSEGFGLKCTVLGQSERSRWAKLDGSNDLKWTVLSRSGLSKRLKVNGLRKDGPKGKDCTI